MFINGDTMKPKHKVKITAKHEKSGKIIECYKHDLGHPHMIGFKETKEVMGRERKCIYQTSYYLVESGMLGG